MVDYQKYLREQKWQEYKSRKWVSDVFCEHCGENQGPGLEYDDGGTSWCTYCAQANGLIDDNQSKLDVKETKKLERI